MLFIGNRLVDNLYKTILDMNEIILTENQSLMDKSKIGQYILTNHKKVRNESKFYFM